MVNKHELQNKSSEIFLTEKKDVDKVINVVKNCEQKDYPNFEQRSELLNKIAEQLGERKEEFANTITEETKKPQDLALGEVDRAIDNFKYVAKLLNGLEIQKMIQENPPEGAMFAITPFNFPLNLPVHKIAPALAVGCPVLFKPDPRTPKTALLLEEVIKGVEFEGEKFPKGSLKVLPLDRKDEKRFASGVLKDKENFPYFSFTGSEVGERLMKNNGRNPEKTILEQGSNSAVIVTKTADIDDAVKKCLFGAYAFGGQVCISVQRVYVHEDIYEEFVEKFKQGLENTEIPALVDNESVGRITGILSKQIHEKGEGVVISKNVPKGSVPAFMVLNPDVNSDFVKKELFGPGVAIMKYTNFGEVIDKVNDSKFGLNAGIFVSKNPRESDEDRENLLTALNSLEVTNINVNQSSIVRHDQFEYGAHPNKEGSGIGYEGPKFVMEWLTEGRKKTAVTNMFLDGSRVGRKEGSLGGAPVVGDIISEISFRL